MKNDFQPQNNFILIKKILNFKKTITNRRFIKKKKWIEKNYNKSLTHKFIIMHSIRLITSNNFMQYSL